MSRRASAVEVEVVVLGGGLTGLTAALALGRAGVEVAVVERASVAELVSAPYDGRVMAIARASMRMLEALGVWASIGPEAQPILRIRVEEGGVPVRVHYDGAELDGGPLGWIAETRCIRRALFEALEGLSGVRLFAPAGHREVVVDSVAATVRLDDGRLLRAPLLLVCEGRRSPLPRRLGIRCATRSYGQIALVATLEQERAHGGEAVERFFPDGPFAVLPLPGRRSSIVWAICEERARALCGLDPAAFALEVEERFGDLLGRVRLASPLWSYPLLLVVCERYVRERVALVGDAARGIHPLAGQGWNLALRDVAALAELVVDRLRLGLDPGSLEMLRAYEAWRRFDGFTLVAVTDGLNRLFANDHPPLFLLRNLGLWLVERAPPLKRLFMRHAMGLLGEQPRLLLGQPLW